MNRRIALEYVYEHRSGPISLSSAHKKSKEKKRCADHTLRCSRCTRCLPETRRYEPTCWCHVAKSYPPNFSHFTNKSFHLIARKQKSDFPCEHFNKYHSPSASPPHLLLSNQSSESKHRSSSCRVFHFFFFFFFLLSVSPLSLSFCLVFHISMRKVSFLLFFLRI